MNIMGLLYCGSRPGLTRLLVFARFNPAHKPAERAMA